MVLPPPPPARKPAEPIAVELELPLPSLPPPSRETQPEETRFVVVDLGETGDWIRL